ncbi:hypothetical protein L6452_38061 [Arctium lappa]|uniref:Uncharacterized protein n=1 Tax=Arctium lappa TaxID=4217 RepID=A0ACB8Y563_ARCLA|nr:hypothetical protein L6452_38061 [Arctium lappa]
MTESEQRARELTAKKTQTNIIITINHLSTKLGISIFAENSLQIEQLQSLFCCSISYFQSISLKKFIAISNLLSFECLMFGSN